MKTFGIAVVAALLMFGMPTVNAACTTEGNAVSYVDVIYTVDDDSDGIVDWIYAESNGISGLQRGGVAWHTNDAEARAYGCGNPDTILY